MNESRRRVGVYERFSQSTRASPARASGIGLVLLVIVILLGFFLTRY